MGEVIRSNAAVKDILKDTREAQGAAAAKKGVALTLAATHLAPVLAMIDAIEADQNTADTALGPLSAALSAANDDADMEIRHVYDDVWNEIGRPQQDQYLSLFFPGGTSYYTDGDTPGQPERMEILAKLFDKKLHPKLTAEQCTAFAARIRDAATPLKAAIDAAAGPAATTAQLDRVHTALARVAQFELTNFKRALKIAGFTETQIHDIIPDRPAAKKAAKKADPEAPPAPPAPPAEPK